MILPDEEWSQLAQHAGVSQPLVTTLRGGSWAPSRMVRSEQKEVQSTNRWRLSILLVPGWIKALQSAVHGLSPGRSTRWG